ncbi:flagellar basal body rod protein FlgC [Pseudoprimorskyibacter insulae]|uniref:Flagellar basal-body rod protein FlgC n=1 Tax=Pseudoprimorskyibacter insulae TaxID=1695997 RepID=A0A2R8AW46_9RHOB|nr:flagellar basal body rod protein FlgC [Pseudoprimorskyibacter insulae]SPF80114.1 Flagellar basal-body rod protein FlgC [Pseudoprimorskyibacter insulae]
MAVNNVFDVAANAMSAQLTRLNTVASNIANAGSVSPTAEGAYRAIRPVFQTEYADNFSKDGLSSVRVDEIVQLNREPVQLYRPDHPKADKDGFVYQAVVNVDEEMVEMLEAGRQYQNTLEAVNTLRTLMARTVTMGS